MFRRSILVLAALLAFVPGLHAQLKVEMRINRRIFIPYEPLMVTVAITNLTGRDITLKDEGAQKWFGFQVFTSDDHPIPPRDVNYQVSPITILAGQAVKRNIDLASLYPVADFGLYRIRASIYFSEMQRYFSSEQTSIEISEGRLIWHQTVGVPEGGQGSGGYRQISAMTFRQPKETILYIRVEDRDAGVIYCTYPLGHVLVAEPPTIELDSQNGIHVLQLVGPKAYLYTRIGLNGEWLGQESYNQLKSKPHLKKLANGNVAVAGGEIGAALGVPEANATPAPKLSDTPVVVPER